MREGEKNILSLFLLEVKIFLVSFRCGSFAPDALLPIENEVYIYCGVFKNSEGISTFVIWLIICLCI